jgi:hypothetical protein
MGNTAKPVVEVIVEKNRQQVTGSNGNFCILQAEGYEGGCALGFGATQEKAIADFIDDWSVKHDEEISVKVIETKIV